MTKNTLRQQLLRRLRRQPEGARRRKSLTIARKLRRLPVYKKARAVMCYAAISGEVETRQIIRNALLDGKRVAVPVTVASKKRLIAVEISDPKRDLQGKGPFGIPEPHPKKRLPLARKKLDLVLVPGVAFDAHGRRLGRGGGYYDRFLSTLPDGVPQIGLAFRFQVVDDLPFEKHDKPVSLVLTD